jgi:hypothetical protein
MFNKFTFKPIDLPIISDADDAKDKTDKTNYQTQDDILGEPPELVDLPAGRIVQNTVVVDGRVSYDNIKESPNAEHDFLCTSLHTINSQQSMDIPVPFTPLKQDELIDELEIDDLSFHASEVDMSELNDMTLIPLQDSRESNEDQDVPTSEGLSLHSLETVAKRLEQQETELKTEHTKPAKSIDRIIYKIIVPLLMLVLLSGIGYALKKSPVDDHETCQQIAVEPDVTARNNTAIAYSPFATSKGTSVITINNDTEGVSLQYKRNATTEIETLNHESCETIPNNTAIAYSPFAASKGKAVNIKIDAKGVLLQYKRNEADIEKADLETFSLKSWETIGTTSLHTSLITLLILISVSKWKSKARGAKRSGSPMIKAERVIGDIDLSAYSNLKVTELRDLLRRRSCSTIGKKAVLIKRLATVYKAELDTLTVVQLRKLLKSMNYTQTGRKDEIVRTLMEAGLERD